MDKKISLQIWLELLWWVLTAVVVVAVLYPIHQAIHVWPFERTNIIFIVVLLTLTRYIFLLQHTFLARRQVLKVGLILLMFPVLFLFIGMVNEFMVFIEEQTWDPLTGHLPTAQRRGMESYIWNEMLFFGAGCLVAIPAFMVRMMLSVWRTRNRGTV
jgi:FlaA1/EpsC-like NDP-sugar epimerase